MTLWPAEKSPQHPYHSHDACLTHALAAPSWRWGTVTIGATQQVLLSSFAFHIRWRFILLLAWGCLCTYPRSSTVLREVLEGTWLHSRVESFPRHLLCDLAWIQARAPFYYCTKASVLGDNPLLVVPQMAPWQARFININKLGKRANNIEHHLRDGF